MSLIHVKNKQNGTTYVYESDGYWDKDKRQARNNLVCTGKLVVGKLIPNKHYRLQRQPDEVRTTMLNRSCCSSSHRLYAISQSIWWDYEETKVRTEEVITDKRRAYIHLYYDDRRKFHDRLDALEQELLFDRRVADHAKQYEKFFIVKETPVRGISVVAKDEEERKEERNFGCFALFSNTIKDPLQALDSRSDSWQYRTCDALPRKSRKHSAWLHRSG